MPSRRSRGERAGLSRASVLDAALRLADREGVRALSMRQLGVELGVEAMAIYNHVSNKEELLDGIVERVMPAVELPGGEWHEALAAFARSLRDALLRHRNVLPLVLTRPAMTQPNLRALEDGVALLCAAGFTPRQALDVVYSVIGFVVTHCAAATAGEPGADPAAMLASIDPDTYPLLAEAGQTDPGTGDDARFEFTLTALLTGFAQSLR